MSLSNTTVKASYAGDNSTLVFAIPASPVVDDSSEILVYLRDETDPINPIETLQVEGILNDYTLTGAPDSESFNINVTFNTGLAPSTDEVVVIIRQLPLTQTLDLNPSGSVPLVSMERAYDRIVAMVQQLNEMLERTPKFSLTEQRANTQYVIPEPVADYFLKWNVTDNGWEWREGTVAELLDDAVTTPKIINDAVTNAKLANMATNTFKGRITAGTGDPEDLTVTQATSMLNVLVGDSGSGGTKGLVPAPAAGDTASSKFLKADGTWSLPPGGGGGSLIISEITNPPVKSFSSNMAVYEFEAGLDQSLYVTINIPSTYIAGSPVKLKIKAFSLDTSGTILLSSNAVLVRSETDDYDSTTNARTSTNSAITMSASNDKELQKIILDVSSTIGQVNAVSIAALDTLIVRIFRNTDTATGVVYYVAGSEEVTFT
jgi:hypothetical protein